MELTRPTTAEIPQPPLDFITGSLQENSNLGKLAWTTSKGTPVELSDGKKVVFPDLPYELPKPSPSLTEHKVEKVSKQKGSTLSADSVSVDLLEKEKAAVSQSSQESGEQKVSTEGQQVTSKKVNWDLLKIPKWPSGDSGEYTGPTLYDPLIKQLDKIEISKEKEAVKTENPPPYNPNFKEPSAERGEAIVSTPSAPPDPDFQSSLDSADFIPVVSSDLDFKNNIAAPAQKGNVLPKKEETLNNKKNRFYDLLGETEKKLKGLKTNNPKREPLERKREIYRRGIAVIELYHKEKDKTLTTLYDQLLRGLECLVKKEEGGALSSKEAVLLTELQECCDKACWHLGEENKEVARWYMRAITPLLYSINENAEGDYADQLQQLIFYYNKAASEQFKGNDQKLIVYTNHIRVLVKLISNIREQRMIIEYIEDSDSTGKEVVQKKLDRLEEIQRSCEAACQSFKRVEEYFDKDEDSLSKMYNYLGAAQYGEADAISKSNDAALGKFREAIKHFEKAIVCEPDKIRDFIYEHRLGSDAYKKGNILMTTPAEK